MGQIISRLGYLKINGWKKGAALLKAIIGRTTAVINRFSNDRAFLVGAHRFFKNRSVSYQQIMETHYHYLSDKVSGKDLICLQDTTEYNYQHHSALIKAGELGKISDGRTLGLRVHPTMVMDARDGFTYGISSLEVINRNRTALRGTQRHDRVPIEKKESYRWLSAIKDSKERLSQARSLTFVSDRESDIYQLWSRVPDERTHLVIRCCFFRKFTDLENEKEVTRSSPLNVFGQTTIHVCGQGKGIKSRDALLEISVGKVWTLKPLIIREDKANRSPDRIALTMVAVREICPADAVTPEPITWFLLTDLPVSNLKEALGIVDIYKSRWQIEQLFRLTKQKGLGVEESQLERAHSLSNLIAMVFIAAVRIHQMVSFRHNEGRSGTDLFNPDELDLLERLKPKLEGKTERSKNKNKPGSLAYFLWTMARLGNWKPEDRDPPGPVTFKRGWEQFDAYKRIAKMLPP